jgi:hypothetical protein
MTIKLVISKLTLTKTHKAAQFVETINGGYLSVPTLVFPDGTTLTEPSNPELLAAITKLGNVNSING